MAERNAVLDDVDFAPAKAIKPASQRHDASGASRLGSHGHWSLLMKRPHEGEPVEPMKLTRPDRIKLTPQQRRVFDALRSGWCNVRTVEKMAACDGYPSSCEGKVLVANVKRIVMPHGCAVEKRSAPKPEGKRGRPNVLYRIIPQNQIGEGVAQ